MVSAACAFIAIVTVPSPPVDAAVPGGCPDEPILPVLVSLRDQPGPLAERYGLPPLNERAPECFAEQEITLLAFRGSPEGLGGATELVIEPAWLDPHSSRHFLAASDEEEQPGQLAGPFFAVAVPPDLQSEFDELAGEWVSVTGRFDDPAASDCRLISAPSTADAPTPDDVVALCRTSFVLSAIAPAPLPCPEDDISFTSIGGTPEHLRARCFGGRDVSFPARGYGLMAVYPLHLPAVNPWVVVAPVGPPEDAGVFEAFISSDADVPVPSGVPRMGDGGEAPDVLWMVTGRFDDPRAAECRPNPDAMLVDGEPVVWSDEEALAFCRNRLFIDRLELADEGSIPEDDLTPPSVDAGGLPRLAVAGIAVLAGLVVAAAVAVVLRAGAGRNPG